MTRWLHILSFCFLPPLCRAVREAWGEEGEISMVAEARVWSRQTMWVLTFQPLTTASTVPPTQPVRVTHSQTSADNSTATQLHKAQLRREQNDYYQPRIEWSCPGRCSAIFFQRLTIFNLKMRHRPLKKHPNRNRFFWVCLNRLQQYNCLCLRTVIWLQWIIL